VLFLVGETDHLFNAEHHKIAKRLRDEGVNH
jgi:hypothetical protein